MSLFEGKKVEEEEEEKEEEMKCSQAHVLCMVNECGQTLTRKVDTGPGRLGY